MIPGARDCQMPNTLTLSSLPLFPLGTALFPDGLLPLRIFEVRYLDMIGKCHKAGAPFGVVALNRGHEVRQPGATEEFAHIGTLATIEAFSNPQPGLMLVRCRGTQRFRITQTQQLKHGLWTADVSYMDDDLPAPVPEHLRSTAIALEKLLQTLAQRGLSAEEMPIRQPARLDDCGWVANRWAELLPVALPIKQNLMALDSPVLRLELVSDLLARYQIGEADAP